METIYKKDLETFFFNEKFDQIFGYWKSQKTFCTNNFVFCHDNYYIGTHNYHCPHTTQNNIKFFF
jgi:hypothetical protein